MMNFTGYFLLASKFGGLRRKPSTCSPFAPAKEKDSTFVISMLASKAALIEVTGQSRFNEQDSFPASTSPVLDGHPAAVASAAKISFGAAMDTRLKISVLPSGVTA